MRYLSMFRLTYPCRYLPRIPLTSNICRVFIHLPSSFSSLLILCLHHFTVQKAHLKVQPPSYSRRSQQQVI
jgi:hypothetical protein